MNLTSKMLGDAGEYFVLSQIAFAGMPVTKMPDGWTGYDLLVESDQGLVRVSVKTRSESEGWKTSRWFIFDERYICEWIAFVFKPISGPVRAWIMPFDVARAHANTATPTRKDPHMRDLSWAKLNRNPLIGFEENWKLLQQPRVA